MALLQDSTLYAIIFTAVVITIPVLCNNNGHGRVCPVIMLVLKHWKRRNLKFKINPRKTEKIDLSNYVHGVQVIPERVKILYMNEKYLHNYTLFVKRYSRKSPYYINEEVTIKQEWNNNVTFNLVFNEFLHNEYRRSFIELHYKYCDLLKYEKFIGSRIAAYGIKCPQPAGTYKFFNITTPMDEFPNVFPFEQARLDIEFTSTATSETILKLYFYAHFKNMVHKN